MSFYSPIWLLALLLLPLLAGAYVWHERERERSAAEWATPTLIPNLVDARPGKRRHLPVVLLLVALTAMIVGVARPHATVTVRREEATVMLAIDASRSMAAPDVPPTRLQAAKTAALDFARKVPAKYRIGVIAFATRAVLALPPTTDRGLLHSSLDLLHTGDGTAIGDAVALATNVGKSQRADGVVPPTAVLLISDGARDGGRRSPLAAAQQAKKEQENKPSSSSSAQQNPDSGDKTNQATAFVARMTPQEAAQLLEALKGEEKALIFIPPNQKRTNTSSRVFKDW